MNIINSFDKDAVDRKTKLMRTSRPVIWNILESFDLQIYHKEQYKQYKFLSKSPKEDAARLAKALAEASPYITIHSYLFGNEQIISVDNDKVAYIYLCNFDTDKVKIFNQSNKLYTPEYFINMQKSGGKVKKTILKKSQIIDRYFSECKIPFARNGDYVASVDIWTIAKELKKKYKYNEVRYEISKDFFFEDFRLKKLTFVNSKGPFLHLFNNLEYEALPLIDGSLHPHVVYRYQLYDHVKGLQEMPNFQEGPYPDEYIGSYVNERIEKFKLGSYMTRMPLSHAD